VQRKQIQNFSKILNFWDKIYSGSKFFGQ